MKILLFICFWGFALTNGEGAVHSRSNADTPLKILFIGNSYTTVGNIPKLVEGFAKSRRLKMVCETVAYGGYALRIHWENPEHFKHNARSVLAQNRWDAVILQDQSGTPSSDSRLTLAPAKRFTAEIRKTNARLIFYQTPAHYQPSELKIMNEEQRLLNEAYAHVANACAGEVAPVGEAFNLYYRRNPANRLHSDDNSHFNTKGVYLAGLILYGRITRQSVKGLPSAFKLLPEEVKKLQSLADEVLAAKKNHNSRRKLQPLSPPRI